MSLYNDIYALIQTYIFGGAELDSFQRLVTTEYSLIFCSVALALPVILVFWLARLIINSGARM